MRTICGFVGEDKASEIENALFKKVVDIDYLMPYVVIDGNNFINFLRSRIDKFSPESQEMITGFGREVRGDCNNDISDLLLRSDVRNHYLSYVLYHHKMERDLHFTILLVIQLIGDIELCFLQYTDLLNNINDIFQNTKLNELINSKPNFINFIVTKICNEIVLREGKTPNLPKQALLLWFNSIISSKKEEAFCNEMLCKLISGIIVRRHGLSDDLTDINYVLHHLQPSSVNHYSRKFKVLVQQLMLLLDCKPQKPTIDSEKILETYGEELFDHVKNFIKSAAPYVPGYAYQILIILYKRYDLGLRDIEDIFQFSRKSSVHRQEFYRMLLESIVGADNHQDNLTSNEKQVTTIIQKFTDSYVGYDKRLLSLFYGLCCKVVESTPLLKFSLLVDMRNQTWHKQKPIDFICDLILIIGLAEDIDLERKREDILYIHRVCAELQSSVSNIHDYFNRLVEDNFFTIQSGRQKNLLLLDEIFGKEDNTFLVDEIVKELTNVTEVNELKLKKATRKKNTSKSNSGKSLNGDNSRNRNQNQPIHTTPVLTGSSRPPTDSPVGCSRSPHLNSVSPRTQYRPPKNFKKASEPLSPLFAFKKYKQESYHTVKSSIFHQSVVDPFGFKYEKTKYDLDKHKHFHHRQDFRQTQNLESKLSEDVSYPTYEEWLNNRIFNSETGVWGEAAMYSNLIDHYCQRYENVYIDSVPVTNGCILKFDSSKVSLDPSAKNYKQVSIIWHNKTKWEQWDKKSKFLDDGQYHYDIKVEKITSSDDKITRYLEVKSTTKAMRAKATFTRDEFNFLKAHNDEYRVYRVYSAKSGSFFFKKHKDFYNKIKQNQGDVKINEIQFSLF